MRITILGWYGTETLGDRSILEGILKIFDKIEKNNYIYIGSLYPFFTERTLYEEQHSFNKLVLTCSVLCFYMKDNNLLKDYILKSDLVIMGGGPLMDILELDYINKAFLFAKKHKIKTAIIGCGIGPLEGYDYKRSVISILKNSDLSIFRDKKSINIIKDLNNQFNSKISIKKVYNAYDPAIIPIKYLKKPKLQKNNNVVVNLREFPFKVCKEKEKQINCNLEYLLKVLSEKFDEVVLLPNHTFTIGGDDRKYLSKLKLKLLEYKNITVINEPKSLIELFAIISSSKACIGMRYHAILFQTLLNGNNYILDYTNRKSGKIISFLEMIDRDNFFEKRYYNLNDDNENYTFLFDNLFFEYDYAIFDKTIEFYKYHIKQLMNKE